VGADDFTYAILGGGFILFSLTWMLSMFRRPRKPECQHVWEPDGESVVHESYDWYNNEKYVCDVEHRQPVRCTKCGEYTWFRRA
jgi:hypothetical protein